MRLLQGKKGLRIDKYRPEFVQLSANNFPLILFVFANSVRKCGLVHHNSINRGRDMEQVKLALSRVRTLPAHINRNEIVQTRLELFDLFLDGTIDVPRFSSPPQIWAVTRALWAL